MNRILLSTTLALAAATPLASRADDAGDNLNRWSFGPRFGLNFKGSFKNNNALANPGPAAGGANHFYNDGYVKLDSSGDAGGTTWNWGYQNSSQVVGDTMQFHAVQQGGASGLGSSEATGVQYGGEIIYQRIMGRVPGMTSVRWGLEGAFGYTDLDLRDNRNVTGPATLTTDTYQLNGVLPPGAGYQGTFQGPGTLLGDTPTRTSMSGLATLASHQKLTGQIFAFRVGPFAEWNLTEQLSLAASVGLTLAPACVDYDYSESVTFAGGSPTTVNGHSSKSDLLYGPYVSAMLRYDFSGNWGVFAGAQFQNLTDLKLSTGGRTATLDQGATVYLTAGATWRF